MYRSRSRWSGPGIGTRADAEKAMTPGAQGKDALGGRFVSPESLATHFDEQGRSKALDPAQQIAAARPSIQSVRVYTVSGPDQPAQLASVAQRGRGMKPVGADLYRAARAAGMARALPGSGPQAGQAQTTSSGQQTRDQGERPAHLNRQDGPGTQRER